MKGYEHFEKPNTNFGGLLKRMRISPLSVGLLNSELIPFSPIKKHTEENLRNFYQHEVAFRVPSHYTYQAEIIRVTTTSSPISTPSYQRNA